MANAVVARRQTSIQEWEQLKNEVFSIPIYLVACHSAICFSYEHCRTPSRGPEFPKFQIPPSTYILNFTSGGEYCMFGGYESRLSKTHRNEFRKLLLLDDRSDIEGQIKGFSFLSSVMRATNTIYPNISCTFKEDEGQPNQLGVFDLDTTSIFNNKYSILSESEPGPYKEDPTAWYLDDIIHETYKRTGNSKGIFLFAGCSSALTQASSAANLAGPIGKSIADSQQLFYIADIEYNTLVPTIDKERIREYDPSLVVRNVNLHAGNRPIAQPDPTAMASLIHATGETMEGMFPEMESIDPENVKKARSMLNSK